MLRTSYHGTSARDATVCCDLGTLLLAPFGQNELCPLSSMSFRLPAAVVGVLPPSSIEVKVVLPSPIFNPTPVVLSFPPETTAKDIVAEISRKCNVQGEDLSLVIPPTAGSHGGVVDSRTPLKSFHLDSEVSR